jgi:hypothetical protein
MNDWVFFGNNTSTNFIGYKTHKMTILRMVEKVHEIQDAEDAERKERDVVRD